jgi:hypothetical protein
MERSQGRIEKIYQIDAILIPPCQNQAHWSTGLICVNQRDLREGLYSELLFHCWDLMLLKPSVSLAE